MKNLVLTLSAVALLLLNGCSDENVTTQEVLDRCADIAGTYNGSYSDTSCTGSHSNGTISNYSISDGCSAEIKGFILSANGNVTNIDANGNAFNVRVETPPGSTCGGLSGTCNKISANSYACNYSWDQGGGGTMNVSR